MYRRTDVRIIEVRKYSPLLGRKTRTETEITENSRISQRSGNESEFFLCVPLCKLSVLCVSSFIVKEVRVKSASSGIFGQSLDKPPSGCWGTYLESISNPASLCKQLWIFFTGIAQNYQISSCIKQLFNFFFIFYPSTHR